MNILLTGGAGYIGSHVNKELHKKGFRTIVVDNLVNGHRELVRWGSLMEVDLLNRKALEEIFRNTRIEAVMHFAAFAYVGESVKNPKKYYVNNVIGTLNLLEVMTKTDVDKIIFSSTCAVYGNPEYIPMDEEHPRNPINPYGRSKLTAEHMLEDFCRAYGLRYVYLRYFNAAGADSEGEIGEWHEPETHLIPNLLDAALGIRSCAEIFGTDYDTPDGTCIRDFIHVTDLAEAHVKALVYLLEGGDSDVFNLGTGTGYSVREVVGVVEKVTGRRLRVKESPRRPGDPPVLVASPSKASRVLNWRARFGIEDIVRTAWEWHRRLRSLSPLPESQLGGSEQNQKQGKQGIPEKGEYSPHEVYEQGNKAH